MRKQESKERDGTCMAVTALLEIPLQLNLITGFQVFSPASSSPPLGNAFVVCVCLSLSQEPRKQRSLQPFRELKLTHKQSPSW